jgi:uncharacterized protein YndB with AHSA1/START domain
MEDTMVKLHVAASGTTQARPEAVWALLADASSYSTWGPWSASRYDTSADWPASSQAGAVRRLQYGRTTTVEQLLEVEPYRRMTYTVLAGLPVRNYLAEVTLTETQQGTRVDWSADWDRTLLGRVVHRKLQSVYPDIVRRLLSAAEQGDHRAG